MTRCINTRFDDHDYDQLEILARLNRIKKTELIRRICKAHLDKSKKVNLREEASA